MLFYKPASSELCFFFQTAAYAEHIKTRIWRSMLTKTETSGTTTISASRGTGVRRHRQRIGVTSNQLLGNFGYGCCAVSVLCCTHLRFTYWQAFFSSRIWWADAAEPPNRTLRIQTYSGLNIGTQTNAKQNQKAKSPQIRRDQKGRRERWVRT